MTLPFPFPVAEGDGACVRLLDQTKLPGEVVFRDCRTVGEVAQAIRELAVRGAPAIGIAAAYALAMSWQQGITAGLDGPALLARLQRDHEALAATRPTAVNLFWALTRMSNFVSLRTAAGDAPAALGDGLLAEARAIHAEDIAMGRAMGRAGAALLPDDATVLTHCNAGGLATGGYGTAVGVVYAARELGKHVAVFADETRPLLQGARLTAFELQSQGIDVTVIPDAAAATVLRRGGIDAVITGADRIARNGDTANKIGTYPLAVMARRHDVPFYVAAPASTFDPATASGDAIVIEERDAGEVHTFGASRTTPAGVGAFNPAFDVPPAELITAFITELGVLRPPYAASLREIMAAR
jgi:methylthioribose-1-phosphate isomerase